MTQVQRAKLLVECDAGRVAGDLSRMQAALQGLTNLYRAMYGHRPRSIGRHNAE
ncbi:hypothetical protein [Bradyrhizobium sp. CCGUVB14]|uniref:hypothetical protein n=1 Tax=Bradyrhizobium sp. CCGUVB14 TaxID=2949628 RepID=UPI0020B3689E|nr:hypothetical protein [Bradyrhizobium sp. CCGUVB14]MCP3444106.1 hypothetical protein [Bradyrhizobium sp. CCGUVB14]